MKARHEFDMAIHPDNADDAYNKYLRTYFAAMAMIGICANHTNNARIDDYASDSVKLADALINELNKQL